MFWLHIPDTTISYYVMRLRTMISICIGISKKNMHVLVPSFWISGIMPRPWRGIRLYTVIICRNGSMFGNLLKYYTSGNDNYLKEHPFYIRMRKTASESGRFFPYMRRQRMSIISRRIFNRRMHIIILLKICKTNLRLKRMSCWKQRMMWWHSPLVINFTVKTAAL